jgi:protein TonB
VRLAFLLAALLHLLGAFGAWELSVARQAWRVPALPAPTPTPVMVVFYETRPAAKATPPPDTAVASDRASRARSEVVPSEPSTRRQPAAAGDSSERRPAPRPTRPTPPGAPPAPPEPPPKPAPTPDERLASLAPIAAADVVYPPRAATPPRSERWPRLGGLGRGSWFDNAAVDQAIRSSGFGNRASAVMETGPLEFDVKDFEWGPYARQLYEVVERNWKSIIPPVARMPGVTGVVKLRFRIARDGVVDELELLSSSGRSALDQASLASIRLSNPLPALPPEFQGDDVGVSFAYYYNLPIPER